MTTFTGTQDVEPGLYLNLRRFSVSSIESRGPLPGTENDRYRRVPLLAMLALAPLFGLVYVIFLPLIGFAMVAWLAGAKASQLVSSAAVASVRVLRPGWAPALAFLSRSKPAKPDEADDAGSDAWTEEVEKKMHGSDGDER